MQKKFLYISEEANEMWLKLVAQNERNNQSQFFKKMVRETYEHHLEGGANC